MGKKIKKGDKIKVDYEGKFKDGKIFDSSKHGDNSHPLEFEVGSGQVIKGFDEAVMGMEKGQSKNFSIKSVDAYGEKRDDLKKDIPRSSLPPAPEGQEPKPGMILVLQSPQGQQFPAQILKVTKENITLDLNHPLAGQDLFFDITIAEVVSK